MAVNDEYIKKRDEKFKKAQKKFDKEWEKEKKRILDNINNIKICKEEYARKR